MGTVIGTTDSLFQSLDSSFGLKGLKADVVLLRSGNKDRAKCPMKAGKCFLEAATYPFEAFSYGDVEFGAPPLPIDCEQYFEASSETEFEIVPFYGSCSMFGIFSAVVNTGECHRTIDVVEELAADEFDADADIACGAEPITISTFTCEFEIGSQEGLGPVTLTSNTEFGVVTADFDITELAYTVTKDGVSCPFSGTGPKSDGTYSSVEDLWIEGFEHEIWVAEP